MPSIPSNPQDRVIVFIDGSNLFWGLKYYNKDHGTDFRIDYEKLRDFFNDSRRLIRPYYYGSTDVPINPKQANFLDFLRFHGFQVVTKPLKAREDSAGRLIKAEKGADVAMATDFLSLAWEDAYDVAVMVSGDADFVGAVEKVKAKGKRVEIASFSMTLSGDMKRAGDRLIVIDDIIDKIKRV